MKAFSTNLAFEYYGSVPTVPTNLSTKLLVAYGNKVLRIKHRIEEKCLEVTVRVFGRSWYSITREKFKQRSIAQKESKSMSFGVGTELVQNLGSWYRLQTVQKGVLQ